MSRHGYSGSGTAPMHWDRGTLHRVRFFFALLSSSGIGCVSHTVWLEDEPEAEPVEDTGPEIDSGTDTGGDTSETPIACVPPLPGAFDLVTPVGSDAYPEFELDDAGWALGLVHANRQLATLVDTQAGPELSPSWFLALSLSATGMDCTAPGGCYGFSESNQWTLLCELYEELDCEAGGEMESIIGATDADIGRAGAGTLAMAWHAALGYALLPKGGFDDPNDWLSGASDPLALEKVLALSTIDSPWSATLRDVATGCRERPIEDCIDEDREWVREQLIAIAAHIEELDAAIASGHCLELSVSSEIVSDYGTQLSRLFPMLDWTDAIAGAAAMLPSEESLLDSADGVLDALDAHSGLQLTCPEEALETLYETSCPP